MNWKKVIRKYLVMRGRNYHYAERQHILKNEAHIFLTLGIPGPRPKNKSAWLTKCKIPKTTGGGRDP